MDLPQIQQPAVQDRRQSPPNLLDLETLSSNNPFRRAASPAIPSPSNANPPSRPVSRNPFLAPSEVDNSGPLGNASLDAWRKSPIMAEFAGQQQQAPALMPQKTIAEEEAARIFESLSLEEKQAAIARVMGKTAAVPPPQRTGPPPQLNGHRTALSDEMKNGPPRAYGSLRGPPGGRPRPPPGAGSTNNIFNMNTSPKRENQRPRRNSESSAREMDDEKRQAERERRRRERDRSDKPKSGSSRTKRPNQGLDVIDKLDVTGIYGAGLPGFHHDGPFDACRPQRNRAKDSRFAPMHAFAPDSANNTMGGSGPINKNINHDLIHGRGAEGFTDFNAGTQERAYYGKKPSVDDKTNFFGHNPASRELLHGEETYGLGTSTFLEGAPASRIAIQRRESENEAAARAKAQAEVGGLGRKKSLAQRFRGMSQSRRDGMRSPEARYQIRAQGDGTTSPYGEFPRAHGGASTTGGQLKMYEANPFFNEYDDAYEKKGATIKVAEQEKIDVVKERPSSKEDAPGERVRSPAFGGALERRVTEGGYDGGAGLDRTKSIGGGFLSRVKSLKGRGRKEVRRES